VVEAKAIRAYAAETGQFLAQVLANDSDYMTGILVSPNGKFLAINDTSSREYRIIGLDQVSWLGERPGILYRELHFSRDGKLMAEITNELGGNQLRFWDLDTGNELSQRQGRLPTTGPAEIAFNSDFSQAATLGTDGYYQYVYLWDAQKLSLDKVLTQPFPHSKRSIRNLAFTPDDRLLFAHGIDPEAFLFWEVKTGKLLAELPAKIHLSELGNPLAFSPDGSLLLIVDGDGTIHAWGLR
jgi:WD40 repeat protein